MCEVDAASFLGARARSTTGSKEDICTVRARRNWVERQAARLASLGSIFVCARRPGSTVIIEPKIMPAADDRRGSGWGQNGDQWTKRGAGHP